MKNLILNWLQILYGNNLLTNKNKIKYNLLIILSIFFFKINAQVPNISYNNTSPYTFAVGTAINPITPTNTGGSIPASAYGSVSTFAGLSTAGDTNGNSWTAKFNNPWGVVIDANGNLFVSDLVNNKIRKITPTGMVSTFAGNGTAGNTDGIGVLASFNYPTSLALDSNGNLYVSDSGNRTIRKITPDGVVSTFAGNGLRGEVDGIGISAGFIGVTSLVFDSSGILYVTDGNKIRKITPDGMVSTFVGNLIVGYADGVGVLASFNQPSGIAIDNLGNLFVTSLMQNNGYAIRKITPTGVVSTIKTADPVITGRIFELSIASYAIVIDNLGQIYIRDDANRKIRKINQNGELITVAGNGLIGYVDGTASTSSFGSLGQTGMVLDNSGNLFIADRANHKIRKTSIYGYSVLPDLPLGLHLSTSGVISGTPQEAKSPKTYTITAYNAMGQSSSSIVIGTSVSPPIINYPNSNYINYSIGVRTQVNPINTGGKIPSGCYANVTTLSALTTGNADSAIATASFNKPFNITINNSDDLFVTDSNNNRIRKISAQGYVNTVAGGTAGVIDGVYANATFNNPQGICIDNIGNVFIGDSGNRKVRKISNNNYVSTFAGSGLAGSTDGVGTAASFGANNCMAFDTFGNLYSGDSNKIRKITSNGTVSTFAVFLQGSVSGLAFDSIGNLFASVTNNLVNSVNVIYKITPSGIVSVFAGGIPVPGNPPPNVFIGPSGLIFDKLNNLYVCDTGNRRICKITPSGTVSTFAGSGTAGSVDGIANSASFSNPSGITIDSFGNLFVTDGGIRKIPTYGYSITPSLPSGLAFECSNGTIWGTATATISESQVYTVTAYNLGGVSSCNVRFTTRSLETTSFEKGMIKIYPNPANDKFIIDFGNELISNYTIKINNLLGQEVYSNIVDKPKFEITKTWQGAGMFFIKVYNEQNNVVAVKKIILQ
jgi:sugar lactone lactonase YvrE